MFALIFNISDRSSWKKLKEHWESMKKNGNKPKMVFLIGMLYSPKHPIEVGYQEASHWASDSGFYGFFVTNKSNIILNRQVKT